MNLTMAPAMRFIMPLAMCVDLAVTVRWFVMATLCRRFLRRALPVGFPMAVDFPMLGAMALGDCRNSMSGFSRGLCAMAGDGLLPMLGIGFFGTVVVCVRGGGAMLRIDPFGCGRAVGGPGGLRGRRCVRGLRMSMVGGNRMPFFPMAQV